MSKNDVSATSGTESHHYEVRKIQNGFVLKHSHSTPTNYKTEETYHPTMPKILLQPADPIVAKQADINAGKVATKSAQKLTPLKAVQRQKMTKPVTTGKNQ